MVISKPFRYCVYAFVPALSFCFSMQAHSWGLLKDRFEECGARKIDRRIASWQTQTKSSTFGIDLSAREEKIITFRWTPKQGKIRHRNDNTQDGFQFFPCSEKSTQRWKAKQARQQKRSLVLTDSDTYKYLPDM